MNHSLSTTNACYIEHPIINIILGHSRRTSDTVAISEDRKVATHLSIPQGHHPLKGNQGRINPDDSHRDSFNSLFLLE